MKRERACAGLVFALAVAACVTINVYFPEAAIKDIAEQIESEVQKKAAEAPDPAAEPAPGPQDPQKPREPASHGSGAGLLGLLGVSAAYAQEQVPAPEVSNPAIRKIIDSRAQRLPQLNKYKRAGVIGENNKGFVEVLKLEAVSGLGERAEVQRLVRAENADREQLYKEIAAATNVDASQIPRIGETYAEKLRELAHSGDWIQQPDGRWVQKP